MIVIKVDRCSRICIFIEPCLCKTSVGVLQDLSSRINEYPDTVPVADGSPEYVLRVDQMFDEIEFSPALTIAIVHAHVSSVAWSHQVVWHLRIRMSKFWEISLLDEHRKLVPCVIGAGEPRHTNAILLRREKVPSRSLELHTERLRILREHEVVEIEVDDGGVEATCTQRKVCEKPWDVKKLTGCAGIAR